MTRIRSRVLPNRWLVAAALVSFSVAGVLLAARSPGQQEPTFRSSVDLIAVDVQVVDKDGRPISKLTPDQFEVSIDGGRRRVVSADFVENADIDAPARQPRGPLTMTAAPEPDPETTPGRVFVIGVDVASFGVNDSRSIITSARQFIAHLQPEDLVGVYAYPVGPKVMPTTDHALVSRRLDTIVGSASSLQAEYHLSPMEIVDINAEISRTSATNLQGRGGNAVTPDNQTDTLRRVQRRECGNAVDVPCVEAIENTAVTMGFMLEGQATESLNGLRSMTQSLSAYPGRKTLIILSAGMVVSDRPGGRPDVGDLPKLLGQDAARANTTIYALHVDSAFWRTMSADRGKTDSFPLSKGRDRAMLGRVLDEFTGASGGAMLPVLMGDGSLQFDRVLRETSSHYLLGVEPAAADRDGKLRGLKVRVRLSGVTVRSRLWVVVPKKVS
jgi:VWFA-related protein